MWPHARKGRFGQARLQNLRFKLLRRQSKNLPQTLSVGGACGPRPPLRRPVASEHEIEGYLPQQSAQIAAAAVDWHEIAGFGIEQHVARFEDFDA